MQRTLRPMLSLVSAATLGALMLGGPVPADAAGTTHQPPVATVNGTQWVQVSTTSQLEYIDKNQIPYLAAHIELMDQIALPVRAPSNWVPIGTSTAFSGTFNGQGYAITNVVIDDPSSTTAGFFGVTTGTVENVGVAGTVTTTAALGYVGGGLVGEQKNGLIEDVSFTGTVSGGVAVGGWWDTCGAAPLRTPMRVERCPNPGPSWARRAASWATRFLAA